jgi:hypothetical protein
MKRRKRMGLPKAGATFSRPMRGAARQSPPEDAVEMLHDIMEEQQLAAKQRRLLELAASRSQGESTPHKVVALLNPVA